MRVEKLDHNMQILSINAVNTADKDFFQVLNSTYSTELNEKLKDKAQRSYCKMQCNTYKRNIIDIGKCSEAEIDTGRYQIQNRDGNVIM